MISVYKIGGNVLNDAEELSRFLRQFSKLPGKKILVHGGGKEASEFSRKVGLEPKMIDGRRITDRETLDIVTMVYAGLINKRIVGLLQDFGCDAVGLSGVDGNLIPAKKRNTIPIDFGFVGDINPVQINIRFILELLENRHVPVICSICRNPNGGLLNCNADTIASSIAIACSAADSTMLTFCFEKPGVLSDINDETSVVSLITADLLVELLENGVISGGMIPKVTNAMKAIESGVKSVRICDSKNISTDVGTIIRNE